MEKKAIIQSNLGGLNTDSEPVEVHNGDYLDALNIRGGSEYGASKEAIEIIRGNNYAFAIEHILAQNKIILIEGIGVGAPASPDIAFYYPNGEFISNTNGFTDVAGCEAEIDLLFPSSHFTVTYTSPDASTLYVEIEAKTDIIGFDYIAVADNAPTTALVITTVQEAWTEDMAGVPKVIGSKDINNDLFFFATPNDALQESQTPINILGITSAFPPEVSCASAHGFSEGQQVLIKDTVGTSVSVFYTGDLPNGVFLVHLTGTDTFELVGVDATDYTYVSGGTTESAVVGVGIIGVATRDDNTDSWTNYSLLISREFNFSTQKQIDCDGERNGQGVSLYYTDDFNNPRVFYYKGAYQNNGALHSVDPANIYLLGGISDQSRLSPSALGLTVTFDSQIGGGNLKSGNYRYAVRLLTASLTGTAWTELSNPINVYAATTGSPFNIRGDNTAITYSAKSNVLTITGSNLGLFRYVEVAYIHYTGTSFEGAIIGRTSIIDGASAISFVHSGYENTTTALDIGTLNSAGAVYATAKNLRIVDARLVLSNLSLNPPVDFTAFTEAIEYSLLKDTITGVGSPSAQVSGVGDFYYGEYADPTNVFNKVGYMLLETYRFGMVYELKDGSFTPPFYLGYDITIDCTGNASCVAPLTDYDLNDADGTNPDVYIPYIRFHFPNLNTRVGDQLFSEVVARIHPFRAEVVNPYVLGSGIVICSVSDKMRDFNSTFPTSQTYMYWTRMGEAPNSATPRYGENPYFIDQDIYDPTYVNFNFGYPPTAPTESFSAKPQYSAFYSPDLYMGGGSIAWKSGDSLINLGAPVIAANPFAVAPNTTTVPYTNVFAYDGVGIFSWKNGRDDGANPPQIATVNELYFCQAEGEVTFLSGDIYTKRLSYSQLTTGIAPNNINMHEVFSSHPSPVMYTTALVPVTANPDVGVYNAIYTRYTADPYGDFRNNSFVPTGAVYDLSTDTGAILDTFGGDTFTQRQYLKTLSPVAVGVAANVSPTTDPSLFSSRYRGAGIGIEFYCQSRVNTQMQYYQPITSAIPYPTDVAKPDGTNLVEEWLSRLPMDTYHYDQGYSIRNQINNQRAYDPDTPIIADLPSTIAWSEEKPNDSLDDNYRVFLPLNIRTESLNFGEINHMENLNGELMVIQVSKYLREYFNSTSLLTTTEGSEIVTGDGSVLGRKPLTVSTYGTRNKWSCVKGKSAGGDDEEYWFDADHKLILRYGRDGLIPISIRGNMDAWCRNNLTWAALHDTPAHGEGVCGVWNDLYKEVIWSVRAKREVQAWTAGDTYENLEAVSFVPLQQGGWSAATNTPTLADGSGTEMWGYVATDAGTVDFGAGDIDFVIGDYVVYSAGFWAKFNYATFSQTGEIYIANQSVSAGESPLLNPEKWDIVAHTNNLYYNEWSIAWTELRNKFNSYRSPLNKIYLTWKNSYLSPRITDFENVVFEENVGSYATWWDIESAVYPALVVNGYITSVFNALPNYQKTAEAVRIDSYITPYHVDFTTQTQQSYLDDTDFLLRENYYDSTVKNDSTVSAENPNGLNDVDTGNIYSEWISAKFVFLAGTYQKLKMIILKTRLRTRFFNK